MRMMRNSVRPRPLLNCGRLMYGPSAQRCVAHRTHAGTCRAAQSLSRDSNRPDTVLDWHLPNKDADTELPNLAVSADVALAAFGTTQQMPVVMPTQSCARKLVDLHLDVSSELAHERRRDVSTLVKWDGGATPIGMTKLLVRASLANFTEPSLVSTPTTWCGLSGVS